jgi:DNA modification methylase
MSTITVLGKTFNSEEERRAYFRAALREKLPELKKMEGFPIGEDDDILNLSDPPYYTACPNPWLNDFIAQWEREKVELEKKGIRQPDFKVEAPYASDVSEGKNNPVYTGHTYHTKVPHPAIMRYLLYYTEPGDIIFDGFAGTGMTGVATQMLNKPDNIIKHKIEVEWKNMFNQKPIWGKRNVIISDLSPAATIIANNYVQPFDIEDFQKGYDDLTRISQENSHLYKVLHNDNNYGQLNFAIWSDIFLCPNCNEEIVFWESAVDHETGKMIKNIICPNCSVQTTKNKLIRNFITTYDSILGEPIKVQKSIPVVLNYTYQGKRFQKRPDSDDLAILLNRLEFNKFEVPISELPSGYNTTQPLKSHGYSHVHHFYTSRNLFLLSKMRNKIDWNSPISFVFTSMIMRSTNLNRLVVNYYFNGGGGANGAHLKGTLYVSSLPTESSVDAQLKSKYKSSIRALSFKKLKSNYSISTGTASDTGIANNSIDYIFTDPPFGANIMYSELNYIWESWLKVKTNNKLEAIENKVHNKNLFDYQAIMIQCLKEYYRILKPGKWMTVEFSNTSASVWNTIQLSIQQAGFIISNVSAIDKKQGSFKAVTTATAVKQDLVISCYKPSSKFDEKFQQHQHSEVAVWDFVEEHLEHLPVHLEKDNSTTAIIERSPKILFDRLIAFYVQRGLPVPIDAGNFQKGLRERFIERDGMFFMQEQAAEYDVKKQAAPNFVQLSLLVSSEQDGVLWLRNLLETKSLAYQDIQPQWMQALAGVRKGDMIPELMSILEENFLKDDKGKWYLPDVENEIDLEKLRTKRLLRQFDGYKELALKPKGKLKEVRVEALRAGFKHCYQTADFKLIILIGDKIPNNLLMEDEILLQFYDIATNKL